MSPKAGAYVTLLTKPTYLAGTLVLEHGLRSVQSKHPFVVMVTPALPQWTRDILKKRGILTREVELLKPKPGTHALAAHDERFADTWTKLRGFSLTEYERIVLLDCDMIVCRNMDELMELDLSKDQIAAVHVCACNPRKLKHYPPDWIPENCAHTAVTHPKAMPPPATVTSPRPHSQLNSGTVVLNPSKELADAIEQFLWTDSRVPEFLFPDQDLLTEFFKGKWTPLPWYFNALKTLRFIHPQEWSDEEVRCLHYILPDKPWKVRDTNPDHQFHAMNKMWWDQFEKLGEEMKVTDLESWMLVLSTVDTEGTTHP